MGIGSQYITVVPGPTEGHKQKKGDESTSLDSSPFPVSAYYA
jgi:hypothetical protein